MGAREIHRDLEQWEMDAKALSRRVASADDPGSPRPGSGSGEYAVWLLAQG